jgi:DNA ligase-1
MNEDLTAIAKTILAIENASGLAKQNILRLHEHVTGLKAVLKFIYNPYCKTGISESKLRTALAMSAVPRTSDPVSYEEVIWAFTENISFYGDVSYAARFLRTVREESGGENSLAMFVAQAMLTQELTIGVTATTLNNVYGAGFIPMIGCMLGTNITKIKSATIKWPCIITEKLDGVRRIIVKRNGICLAYSRSGHPDYNLGHIINEIEYLPDNYVYDGELLAAGFFLTSMEARMATISAAATQSAKTVTFNIFDMVPIDEFFKGAGKTTALERKLLLGGIFGDTGISALTPRWSELIALKHDTMFSYVRCVPILGYARNFDEVSLVVDSLWADGKEGVMLNESKSVYELKRTKSLIKVKHTETITLKCIGITEGTGKYEGAMGALCLDYKGNDLGVGSGFSDYQRRLIWDHPDNFIGKMVEIEVFGESQNQQGRLSLNCPIFKRFVGDEE